jgi:hypothetical protein
MNHLALLFGLLTLSLAAPTAEPLNTDSDITLEKRKSAQSCKIINVDHYVNCRYQPSLDAGEIFGLKRGTKYVFACKAKGDCYSGNWCVPLFFLFGLLDIGAQSADMEFTTGSSWDQITLYGTTCYVNGYFTDSNCSSGESIHIPTMILYMQGVSDYAW